LSSLQRLDRFSTEPLARSRVTPPLFVGVAAEFQLLSTIGLYGVITADVVERTREVGIRMALGASRRAVLRALMLEGVMMTVLGLIGGTLIAALFSDWIATILYGVSRHDAATIGGVAVLICVVTGVATYLPARRAAGIEPTAALREW
jgi:ABC-type antimicrobial peptide transport system permease subunit